MRKFPSKVLTPREAIQLQQKLRSQLKICPLNFAAIRRVAGADLSYDIAEARLDGFLARRSSNTAYAGVVVLSFPKLELLERRVVRVRLNFPYVPGLLSFRESPAILEAWQGLHLKPDVLLVDGHGFAHPRRFGIACHLGWLIDRPTVGCGKSILVGDYDEMRLRRGRGSIVPLRDRQEKIADVLRTRDGVNPIFVSIGYRVDLKSASRLVLRCCDRYRIPEPTRQAHLLVNAARRGEIALDK
ncbi:MAG: deoxyribonuclease V [Acidobacteriia bacterium]|nr:deoxyribonuclease V [Terriglobia bacterium]